MGMGASAGGGEGGRRGRRRRSHGGAVMSEINMTPFIDVVLVLLIIFMVAAPLMTNSVPIDLPEDAKGKPAEGQVKPIAVAIDPAGKIYVADVEVTLEELVPKLQAIAKNGIDERIVFYGDKAAVWGTTSKVLSALNGAGFHKIAIQMNPN